MKLLIVFALVALVAAQDSTYTNKYDHIDVEEILKSDRLFKNYYNCLIDQGPCTPDAAELKQSLPDALENNCSKCTPKQKETGYKVISSLIENRPAEWAVLQDKYDPERKFVEKYREEAAAAGIKL
ncbi:chemosensory protein 1 [Culex quinquefasciatus]|uniref:Chemosensory protein 1 n=1 Tax=Culex quinquefasciatus TaxID=7176 RepID=B0W7K7_CULQU|nr:chemosensory protein 1 [Culex quinquefasciatus]|eukprot:XP_001844691.1 chemosensory protein 1 [Culex quinquefasciatus]